MFDPSTNLRNIVVSGEDNNCIVEFYADTVAPPFDSADAILRYSNVAGLNIFGFDYDQIVLSFARAKRFSKKEKNTFSLTLDNLARVPADFELSGGGFEGKIMVVRLISRSLTVDETDSLIFFTGRCLKPKEGNKDQLTIEAEQVFGSLSHDVPRRKYTPTDSKGRAASDPYFEGFIEMPQTGITTYQRRTSFLFFFHRNHEEHLQWSSFSDINSSKDLPECVGRVQILGTHLGYADVGTLIRSITAFCEGRIKEYLRVYSTDYRFQQSGTLHYRFGYPPGLGPTPYEQVPIPSTGGGDPPWASNGYYANTAWVGTHWSGTLVDQTDPAPDVAALMLTKIVENLDSSDEFTVEDWSDNAAAIVRDKLLDPNYENLTEEWLNLASFVEGYKYNQEFLFDTSFSDLIFAPAGFLEDNLTNSRLLLPTGSITTEYLQYLNGDAVAADAFLKSVTPVEYTGDVADRPIEPPDFPPGPGPDQTPYINLSTFLRKRYTTNGAATKKQKLWDWLNDVILLNSRSYLTQGFDGRINYKHKKPADFALGLSAIDASDSVLSLDDVSFWIASLRGSVLVQPYSSISEVRKVLSAAYDAAQNDVTLTGSANITITDFAGADGADTPATALITVDSVLLDPDVNSITLDGEEIAVAANDLDTEQTLAGFFYGSINAHPRLRRKFVAAWNPADDFVTVTAKFGTLTLDKVLESAHPAPITNPTTAPTLTATASGTLAAGVYRVGYAYENANGRTLMSSVQSVTLTIDQKITVDPITLPAGVDSAIWYVSPEKDSSKLRYFLTNDGSGFVIDSLPKLNDGLPNDFNRTGTEVLRVEFVFSDRALTRSNLDASNNLKDTFKFLPRRDQNSINLVKVEFRDSTQDFRLVELTVRDEAHIAKVKKENKLEIDGSCIDSFHQAFRIGSGELVENQDADFFYQNESDREALFLEEGDVCAVTDSGGGVVNFPVRVEDIEYDDLASGLPKASFTMRKYSSTLYDDSVVEREIPVFQTLADAPRRLANNATVLPIVNISSNVTLEEIDYTVKVDATAGNKTVTLPPAAQIEGKIYNIKKIDASVNTVTIDADGSELIDGATTKVLSTQYQSVMIQSDGAEWSIL